MKEVDYYFCLNSPWSLFAAIQIKRLRSQHDIPLHIKPIELGLLFEATGGLPLKQRSASRQKYRLQELQRWSKRLALPVNLHPTYFPCDESGAVALVISAELEKRKGLEVAIKVGEALWCENQDISSQDFLMRIAQEFQLTDIKSDLFCTEVKDANTKSLIEKGGFGVPTFIIGEQVFWGQDRIDFVIEALSAM